MSTTVVPGFAWSFTHLKNYSTCPKRYYHYQVAKDVHEPETQQLLDGNKLHAAFDQRVASRVPLPMGLASFEPLMAKLAAAPGQIYTEQKLALTSTFMPSPYFGKGVWFRGVLDYTAVNPPLAVVIDYKTGKPNEEKTQLQLNAALVFHHQPQIMRVRAALMFVHYDEVERAEFVRSDLTEIWGEIIPRVKQIEKARATQEYPPKPSGLCKRYCAVVSCPYHGKGA